MGRGTGAAPDAAQPGERRGDERRAPHPPRRGRPGADGRRRRQGRERAPRPGPGAAADVAARRRARSQRGDGPKGEVLGVARLAGIQAAKQTAALIPLAHPLPLTFVDVSASVEVEAGLVELIAEARTVARTGVEMEAMTACAVAALTVYDMVKGLERGVEIEQVVLLEKSGGRSRLAARGGRRGGGAVRAAIITISSSRPRGEGEDESGPRLAALAARARRRGRRARGDRRRARPDRGAAAPLGRRRGLRADPDQRRHRLRPRRRHPGGDARGDRARGARDRRGDARGLARAHPALDALARRRRHPRRDPDRQLPRQPARHRAGRRGDRRRPPPRLALLRERPTPHD